MGSNFLNLFFRFLLEVVALIVFAVWSWHQTESIFNYVLAVVVPFAMASIWGVFAVPNDPSRSGKTVVKISGPMRLLLEFGFFAFAYWCMDWLGWEVASWIYGSAVLLHYLLSYDRVKWLLMN